MVTARALSYGLSTAVVTFGLMSVVWAAKPAKDASAAASKEAVSKVTAVSSATQRSGTALRDEVRVLLRDVARQAGKPDDAVVRKAVALYQEIQLDTQLRANQREPLRVALRNKLAYWGEQIAQQRAEAGLPAIPATVQKHKVLAQVPGQIGQPGQPPAGGAQPPIDHGQELLELIQDTIVPTTWDVRGGNGVVRYWAPGHALIVRQTGDVHEQLGQLLMDMR
jgi:hypothetical protein